MSTAGGLMDAAEEIADDIVDERRSVKGVGVQACGYLLELSLDWIVRRASENIHHLLSESHVTLIDEPFGRFVHAQALHDLRNLFSKLSGTTGIGRAYAVRLTDEHELVDIAFQLVDGRVLLEMVPAAEGFGERFGSIGGLIAGLTNSSGKSLLDGGARRMRALTGYDRVTLWCGDDCAESCRSSFAASAMEGAISPIMVADVEDGEIALFPRAERCAAAGALLAAVGDGALERLRGEGVRASLRIPFADHGISGVFRCDSRTPRAPNFELHAAAELFAQMFAMQLKIDRLTA